MKVSVIIATYRQPRNITLILQALIKQRNKHFEVIIADDDHNAHTKRYYLQLLRECPLELKYIRQTEDVGFTKTKVLNKAIAISTGEVIAFLDGDCIPHEAFTLEYAKAAEENAILVGRRVFLGKQLTSKVYDTMAGISFFDILFSDSRKKKEGFYLPFLSGNLKRGLVGCNCGFLKKTLCGVNGFDEDFVFWGTGEDLDLEWRLIANGARQRSMKNRAICYHLHHPIVYDKQHEVNSREMMQEKMAKGVIYCKNGIDKYLGSEFKETYPEYYTQG